MNTKLNALIASALLIAGLGVAQADQAAVDAMNKADMTTQGDNMLKFAHQQDAMAPAEKAHAPASVHKAKHHQKAKKHHAKHHKTKKHHKTAKKAVKKVTKKTKTTPVKKTSAPAKKAVSSKK